MCTGFSRYSQNIVPDNFEFLLISEIFVGKPFYVTKNAIALWGSDTKHGQQDTFSLSTASPAATAFSCDS